MSKHSTISILSAILIAAIVAASWPAGAQAQGREPLAQASAPLGRLRRPHAAVGHVSSVSATEIRIDTVRRGEVVFTITAGTTVRNADGSSAALADVQAGGWVRVSPVRAGQAAGGAGKPEVRLIVLLPADFDPDELKSGRGKVTAVDAPNNAFTVENRLGESLTFVVSDATLYKGQVDSLADMEVGMTAGVVAKIQPNGEMLASAVRAGYARVRRVGEITAVNLSGSQFTLKIRRDGSEVTVKVDDQTRFRSKAAAVDGLEDLQPGMKAAIQGQEQADGSILVRVVLALPQR